MLDYLRQSMHSTDTAYDAILRVDSEDLNIHLVVEGGDDTQFYTLHCRRQAGDKRIITYPCGGKEGVKDTNIKIRNAKYNRFPKYIMYFVDRDLDDFIDPDIDESIYVTDYYSFENYFYDIELIRNMIDSEITCYAITIDTEAILKSFISDIKIFSEKLLQFMAIITLYKKEYKRDKAEYLRKFKYKMDLNRAKISSSVFISQAMEVSFAPNIFDLLSNRSHVPELRSEDMHEVSNYYLSFQVDPIIKYIRGKYLIEFITLWLHRFVATMRLAAGNFEVISRIPNGADNFKIYAAPRIATPSSLNSYINKILAS